MDDNLGLGTPNFFSSAWDPEQSDFSLTGGYQSKLANDASYAPHFRERQVENDQLDYFSNPVNQSNQSLFQPKYLFPSENDALDMILAPSEPSQLQAFSKASISTDQMQGIFKYDDSTIVGVTELERLPASNWNYTAKLAPDAKLNRELVNDPGQKTSIRYGQITPVESPPKDFRTVTPKERKKSTARSKQDDSIGPSDPIKMKKPRKSKEKALTKDQEIAKRKKFLDRNRVAADKCRQKRKKWIDDLQAKVHLLNADNATRKAEVEDLEQKVAQLRLILFIHARGCKDKDILVWFEQEARQVELDSHTNAQTDNVASRFNSQDFDEPSSREAVSVNLAALEPEREAQAVVDGLRKIVGKQFSISLS